MQKGIKRELQNASLDASGATLAHNASRMRRKRCGQVALYPGNRKRFSGGSGMVPDGRVAEEGYGLHFGFSVDF